MGESMGNVPPFLKSVFFCTFTSLSASTDLENIFGRKKPELEFEGVDDPDCSFGTTYLVIYNRDESL